MAQDTAIIDFDNAKSKQMLIGWIKSLAGPHRVSIKKARAIRSLNQNAYYWGVVLPAIASGLEEAWGESMDADEAHVFLKTKFLFKPVVNRVTGEIRGRRLGSSADLDTKEFCEYLDNIIKFAGEQLGVEVPPATKEMQCQT